MAENKEFSKVKEYVEEQIATYQEKLDKLKENFNRYSISIFINHDACNAFKYEWFIEHLMDIKYTLDIEDITLKEFKDALNDIIKNCETTRLNGRVISYNTNPMVNLASLWQFECFAEIIPMYKSIKNLCN